jgi:hypothetical protein
MNGHGSLCQLRQRELTTPMGRTVMEAPLWPNDMRRFADHGDLCVHIVLPREQARWGGMFAGVRVLAGRTAHVGVHVQPARGGFSLDPTVLLISGTRRRDGMRAAVIADAADAGVELTPPQVHVESLRMTRSTLRLPPTTGHGLAWGVMSVAWFPLTSPRHSAGHGVPHRADALRGKEDSDGLPY